MTQPDLSQRERPRLLSLAYQLLGGASDAEDIVQEALVRLSQETSTVERPAAWLTTVVTRLCLDHLRSARSRREAYVGPWLPEPAMIDDSFEQRAERAEEVSLAFLVVLEALSPLERAAYLLHQVFDYSFEEVSQVLGRDSATCRKLAQRAKAHLSERRPRFAPSAEAHAALVQSFALAIATGDQARLVSLLTPDASCVSDGGGKRKAALKVVTRAERVAKLLIGLARRGVSGQVSFEQINGSLALVLRTEQGIDSVLTIENDGARVSVVRIVRNPDKLRFLERQRG